MPAHYAIAILPFVQKVIPLHQPRLLRDLLLLFTFGPVVCCGDAEIAGGWLVWQTIRNKKPWYFTLAGEGSCVISCYRAWLPCSLTAPSLMTCATLDADVHATRLRLQLSSTQVLPPQ
jgi:hypothetical protein